MRWSGGGGLIQLPALVLGVPGAAPVQILGDQQVGVDLRYDGQLADLLPPGAAGPRDVRAADGARVRRLALGALWPRRSRGTRSTDRPGGPGRGRRLRAAQARPRRGDRAAVLRPPAPRCRDGHGVRDRVLRRRARAGDRLFFVFTLVGLLGYSFLEASAKARIANWATNLAALVVFVPQGAVPWKVGLVDGRLQPAGQLRRRPHRGGARQAVRAGVLRRRGLGVHREDRLRRPQ